MESFLMIIFLSLRIIGFKERKNDNCEQNIPLHFNPRLGLKKEFFIIQTTKTSFSIYILAFISSIITHLRYSHLRHIHILSYCSLHHNLHLQPMMDELRNNQDIQELPYSHLHQIHIFPYCSHLHHKYHLQRNLETLRYSPNIQELVSNSHLRPINSLPYYSHLHPFPILDGSFVYRTIKILFAKLITVTPVKEYTSVLC